MKINTFHVNFQTFHAKNRYYFSNQVYLTYHLYSKEEK